MDDFSAKIFSIATHDALAAARAYFLSASGLGSASTPGEDSPTDESPIHKRMRKRAALIEEKVVPMANIRAVYRRFPEGALRGDTLVMSAYGGGEKVSFRCAAFERIAPTSLVSAYAYAVTAGDIYLETENISDKLFADIYGTGFVEAASHMLRAHLFEETGGSSHFSFGPGFFGTNTAMLREFERALPLGSIGVGLNPSSVLIPVKSCAGFYIATKDAWRLPKKDCASCTGKKGGCRLCADYGA